MSLFDLFKKNPKKEPEKPTASKAAKPSTDPDFLSPEMQKKRYEAAMEFLTIFQEKMPLVGGKPHAGTTLAIAARLAGTSLYRAMNYKNQAAPGTVVLSTEVDEAWPQLANLFAFYCKQNGIDVMAKPMVTKFPEKDKPLMDVDRVLQEYQDQYHAVMKKHGLDYLNSARAGMVVSSVVFQYHYKAGEMAPDVAAGIVAMGIVEGAKTAPPPLGSGGTLGAGKALNSDQVAEILKEVLKSSVNGSGTRLVLGEGMDAMQDAMANGGKYILVHPAVAEQLRLKGLESYYVYRAALLIDMRLKIPRIDFVKADVDKLVQTWRGKPEEETPTHVRLMLWLKENASANGYEQNGNSWVLKK